MAGRSRWFGAGLAVALVCGGAIRSDVGASLGSGERSVFVPITPCRLFDTRPGLDNVGPRSSPLGPGETFTIQARGPQGMCSLPADASALSLNVAVIGGTAGSFLTVFPAGTALPLAANLNWVAGQPPTPNKVDVGLSADGQVSFYNFAGTVHMAVDVDGYYVDHTHDDRYYRKDETYSKVEVNTKLHALATGAIRLGPASFVPDSGADNYTSSYGEYLTVSTGASVCFHADLDLPDGSTITAAHGRFYDTTALNVFAEIIRDQVQGENYDVLADFPTAGTSGRMTTADTTIDSPVVDRATYVYTVSVCLSPNQQLNAVWIDYSMP